MCKTERDIWNEQIADLLVQQNAISYISALEIASSMDESFELSLTPQEAIDEWEYDEINY